MAEASDEGDFTFSDGGKVYHKKWIPKDKVVAKLIFVHGFSDHIHRYYDLFPILASRGIQVTGWDQRGWGRSVKKSSDKGNTGPGSKVTSDVVEIIKSELPSSVPVFVMGHSMGGGIVLELSCLPEYQYLLKDIRGWLLESPLVALPPASQPGSFKVAMGRLAGRLLPHFQLVEPIPPENCSRDPAVWKDIESDKLCHNTGTLECFATILDRSTSLDTGKYKVNKGVNSMIIFHGSGDKATDFESSKKFLERQNIQDKTFTPLDGWSHMLHADLPNDRDIFSKEVGDWILARCDAKEEGAHSRTEQPQAKL